MTLQLEVGKRYITRADQKIVMITQIHDESVKYPCLSADGEMYMRDGSYDADCATEFDLVELVDDDDDRHAFVEMPDEVLASLSRGTPEQQLAHVLQAMPADLIVMEAFKVMLQRSRDTIEAYDQLSGCVQINIKGSFNMNHGDAEVVFGIGSYSNAVEGQSFPAILNKYINDELFKKEQTPLCLPRA